jgi:amidase
VVTPFVDWIPPVIPAAGAGRGPLAGLRLAVKDIVDVAGLPTGAGHPLWRATHPPPEHTAEVVTRLVDAGAVFVGKTHTDEFAYSMFGSNAHYGTPDNPRAPGRLPGGSSSGSAAAVAAGLADIGLGTDTAGSVRIPASWCGLYALRPSHRRASRDGIVALAPSFDVPGPITGDLATLDRAATAMLSGPAMTDPFDRLLLPPDVWALADPAVREALRPAVQALRAVLPVDQGALFGSGRPDYVPAFAVVQGREFWRAHGAWVRAHGPVFGPGVTTRVEAASARTDAEVAAATRVLAATLAALDAAMGSSGVLVMPSTPTPAPPLSPTGVRELRARLLAMTTLAPIGGLPVVAVPAGLVDGLPVGLSLAGPVGSDEQLIELAALIAPR